MFFTFFFWGSEVCLERWDPNVYFGYLKRSPIFILWEFFKRTHCPSNVPLAQFLFVGGFSVFITFLACHLSCVNISSYVTNSMSDAILDTWHMKYFLLFLFCFFLSLFVAMLLSACVKGFNVCHMQDFVKRKFWRNLAKLFLSKCSINDSTLVIY